MSGPWAGIVGRVPLSRVAGGYRRWGPRRGRLGLRLVGLLAALFVLTCDGVARPSATLFVFAPTFLRPRAVEQTLEGALPTVDVVVFARFADLVEATSRARADGILALPLSLQQLGREPALQGVAEGSALERYVLVRPKDVSGPVSVVAAVDLVGSGEFPQYIRRVVGRPRVQRASRVSKVADLLPVLQFRLADTILIAARFLPGLRQRSAMVFRTEEPAIFMERRVAVAFHDAESRARLEPLILQLGPRDLQILGATGWEAKP